MAGNISTTSQETTLQNMALYIKVLGIHTRQQNGVAKRKNRHLFDVA